MTEWIVLSVLLAAHLIGLVMVLREQRRHIARLYRLLDCALDEHDSRNGRRLDGSHWSIAARRALANQRPAARSSASR